MEEEITSLIAKYGIRDVHSFILNYMEKEYKYLKKIFETKQNEIKISEIKISEIKPLVKEELKKIIPTNNVITAKKYDNPVVIEKTNEIIELEEVEEEEKESEQTEKTNGIKEEGKWKDPKELKVWQKEQEEKKFLENKAKGIKKTDLLTKENLKKWLLEEGRTFSYISREYVGCKDTEVSAAAKLWGIKKPKKN